MKSLVATVFLSLFVLGAVAHADQMAKAKVLKGWISDSDCAAHGDKMCSSKEHIAKGAKLVFVTEADNKILTVSNPSTVTVVTEWATLRGTFWPRATERTPGSALTWARSCL